MKLKRMESEKVTEPDIITLKMIIPIIYKENDSVTLQFLNENSKNE
jgi:hypothetical protein